MNQDLNSKVDVRGIWPFYNDDNMCLPSSDSKALAILFCQLYLHTSGLRTTWSQAYKDLRSDDNIDFILKIVYGTMFIKCSDTSYYDTLNRQLGDPLSTSSFDLR
jgi:hypothetical protein